MFGIDFYPIPPEVIERMLIGFDVCDKYILEPSAGKGNIVDMLKLHGAKEVIACEIDPNLRKMLDVKCNVIGNDCMSLQSDDISHVSFIVMNPPFSKQEKHIKHMWEIAPAGCTLLSLCNASMLQSRYTADKDITDIINLHGSSENWYNCFNDAERETQCDIAFIKLFKPGSGDSEFDGYFDMFEEYEQQENGIMQHNDIREIVNRYVGAVKMYDDVMAKAYDINSMMRPIHYCNITFGAYRGNGNDTSQVTREIFKRDLQRGAWHTVFNKFKMDKYITRAVRDELNKFIHQQADVPFTMGNIYKMIEMIFGTHKSRMDQVLTQAFDTICGLSKHNHTGGEGWKTNSDYMVNRKFIKNNMCEFDRRWESLCQTTKLYHSASDFIDDIVKALCNLTGDDYDTIMSKEVQSKYPPYEFSKQRYSLYDHFRDNKIEWGEWSEWTFFRCKGFKKGTMHFEFKDESVWRLFNQRVAEIRGWALPKSTKKAGQRDYKTTSTSTEITLF